MIYIQKTEPPKIYSDFLLNHKQDIQIRINGKAQKGKHIWSWFKKRFPLEYSELQKQLLLDQGYVCCYCGERLSIGASAIEHLNPKSNKQVIFPFDNLFSSCTGGKGIQITIGKNDNLASLAEKFDIEQQDLVSLNPGKNIIPGELIKICNQVQQGDFCSHAKGDAELTYSPVVTEIFDIIRYELNEANDEVDILPSDSSNSVLQNELDVILNLNHPTLKKKRAAKLKDVTALMIEIIETETEIEQKIAVLKESYSMKVEGKFEAFYFVCLSYINDLSIKYFDN
jgi:5-methylcytosine-specific restriction endonuclease McrA